MRGRAGSVAEISVRRVENFSIKNTSARLPGCRDVIINIPFDKSDTAIRVAKAIICAEVMTLCFAMFSLFLEFRATTRLRLFLISETGLKFFI